jgi:hypothetical protein
MAAPSFMTLTKRMNSNWIGIVSGGDFKHPSMPFCYLGRAEDGKFLGFIQKYAFDKLMIYGEKIEDYIFSREDVSESKVIGTNVPFTMSGKQKIGTKYEVSFKNGKKAVITVVANSAQIVDNVLL